MSEQIPEWLSQRARLTPDRLAVQCEAVAWSYRDLDARASLVAAHLAECGVRAGERVALLADSSPEYAAAVHGVPRAGAVLVPLNTRLTVDELAWQISDCAASIVIADAAHYQRGAAAAAAAGRAAPLDLVALCAPDRPSPQPEVRWVRSETVHTIIYTSGTTGRPKGALLTYGNHLWSAVGAALRLGLSAQDRWIACLPLFHVGGLSILIRAALVGSAVDLHRSFVPAAVNRAIDGGATIVSLVAVMLQRLLDDRAGRPYPPTLRCVLVGGGPLPHNLLRRAVAAGMPVVQTYGLTEAASQVTTLAPEEAVTRLGAAGMPLFPTEIRILAPDGSPLPAGVPGEIAIRGLTVSPGYVGHSAVRPDGWFRTGDIGQLDADGYLTVLDRRDDLIISGGENISPAEVEAVLREHPAVIDAGVVGAPDPIWGQRAVAFVVLAGDSQPDLEAFCRSRLAGYKTPRQFIAVADLPRNAAGKLLRSELRRWLTPYLEEGATATSDSEEER
ncbi:MAG: o-succinylbenzoate--CoA ligase [Chloroflexota bacterium]|nr:o-succinylbenzoate--CoA ligase [Dehalococcoidia bacterium]MDW8254024.1 o-succinylbenzoate--CoA ligase [Chloroflexota bacterium]